MGSHGEQYCCGVIEMIIESYREKPMFYDKDCDKYHRNWRDRSEEELNEIANSIKDVYKIDITGDQVDKQWKDLVSNFRKEFKAQQAYAPSGSGSSSTYTSNWEYFDQMQWLGKHLAHLKHFSTDADEEESEEASSTKEQTTNKYKRTRRSADTMDKLVEQNTKLINFLEKQDSCDPAQEKEEKTKKSVDRYTDFINEGFKKIPGDWDKFQCTTEILAFIDEEMKK